jgi:hypothetical protein
MAFPITGRGSNYLLRLYYTVYALLQDAIDYFVLAAFRHFQLKLHQQ